MRNSPFVGLLSDSSDTDGARRRLRRGSTHVAFSLALGLTMLSVIGTKMTVAQVSMAHQRSVVQNASNLGSSLLDGTIGGVEVAVQATLDAVQAGSSSLELTEANILVGIWDPNAEPAWVVLDPQDDDLRLANAVAIGL